MRAASAIFASEPPPFLKMAVDNSFQGFSKIETYVYCPRCNPCRSGVFRIILPNSGFAARKESPPQDIGIEWLALAMPKE